MRLLCPIIGILRLIMDNIRHPGEAFIDDEWESAVSLQMRYRYSPGLEPALEVYLGPDTTGLGPVLMGVERLGVQKALRWQLGVIFGMERETPDYTLRAVLEFEF
jgi:hypothetical protein